MYPSENLARPVKTKFSFAGKNRKTSNAVDSNDIGDNIVGSQGIHFFVYIFHFYICILMVFL